MIYDNAGSNQKHLKICSINPRSVKNKTHSLCDWILTNDYDLVALTETWLHKTADKASINEMLPTGFDIKHVPCPGGRRGGGLISIYINQ